MTFLSPMAGVIAALLVLPALVALYLLKLRRRRVDVPTTLLWRRALTELEVNSPFQRLRRSLLLLLQLLVLAGLVLAYARPTFRGAATLGDRAVILLDQSASMAATDVKPTRLSEAKRVAIGLVDGVGGERQSWWDRWWNGAEQANPSGGVSSAGDVAAGGAGGGGVMVVSFARGARVVRPFTTDRSLLKSAIESVTQTDEASDLSAALRLVEPYAVGAAGGSPGGEAASGLVVYVVSDGRVTGVSDVSLPGAQVKFVRIGGEAGTATDNVAIVGLASRRDTKRPERVQVFARLANFGPSVVETRVTLKVDGQVARVVSASVPAANAALTGDGAISTHIGEPGSLPMRFDVELAGPGFVEVSHDHADALATDDRAWISVGEPRRLHVLLVTPGNAFIEQAIVAANVKRLETLTPARFDALDPATLRRHAADGDSGFDVLVFDRHAPKFVPPVDGLYFGCHPPVEGLRFAAGRGDNARGGVTLDWKREHPLLRFVTLDALVVSGASRVALPERGEALATGGDGPMIAVVPGEGVRHVVVGFELFKSNWPMQVSFPVFIANALPWLALGGDGGGGMSFQPGDVAVAPVVGKAERVDFEGPVKLTAGVRDGHATLPAFQRVGVYRARGDVPASPGVGAGGVEKPWDVLGVNLLNETESDLRPTAELRVGKDGAAAAAIESTDVRREAWRWFLWAALGLLLIEWVVYTRRLGT